MRSSEPEPQPARDPGYYWVKWKDPDAHRPESDEPFISYYGGYTVRDQDKPIWDAHGQPIDAQIVSHYAWVVPGEYETEDASDDDLVVLSARLEPPK